MHTPASPLFHVVLHEPQIPNNTGNIGRTCLAMGAALHLIEPLGFDIDEKAVRRAGLDYWPRLAPEVYPDWSAYLSRYPDARRWCFEPRLGRPYFAAKFAAGDHLVFGKETGNLPQSILAERADRVVSIPLRSGERSLNLATAVCAGMAEGIRQLICDGRLQLAGGIDLP